MPPRPEIPSLTVLDLERLLDESTALIVLDVREDEERAYCSIPLPPSALNLHIPMRQIPEQLDTIRTQAASTPLVVYCHHGQRSLLAAHWLVAQGLADVSNLDGGIDAWSAAVDPSVPRY